MDLKDKKKIRKTIILEKKCYSLKTQIRVTKKRQNYLYVSETVPSSTNDFTLLKSGEKIPPETNTITDFGYQGTKNIHEKAQIPNKKQKSGDLFGIDKKSNKILSKVRVIIENILGDIKIFRIMPNLYRNKMMKFNIKFKIIAGIFNMKNGFA